MPTRTQAPPRYDIEQLGRPARTDDSRKEQQAGVNVGADGAAAGVRPWSVMHATDHIRGVLELAEAQRDVGMRPVLVTPEGYGSIELYLRAPQVDDGAVSLLSTWQEVRQWRKSLSDCSDSGAMDLVHSHCFAAGMSGVRNWPAVVYDLRGCVEHDADASQQWLPRSLRVAEQFVLTRAQAVVVHWASMRAAALERGTAEEHIFVVPDPVTVLPALAADRSGDKANEDSPSEAWAKNVGLPEGAITFFATDVHSADFDLLLSAFSQVISEVEKTVLLLEGDPASAALRNKLAAAGITRAVRMVTPQQRAGALHSADVIVTGTPIGAANRHIVNDHGSTGPNPSGLEAMRSGRAVLAADNIPNRDLSPEGPGCLGYKAGDARPPPARPTSPARNPASRRGLGQPPPPSLPKTLPPEAAARQYDAVYRHAFARRRDESQNLFGKL